MKLAIAAARGAGDLLLALWPGLADPGGRGDSSEGAQALRAELRVESKGSIDFVTEADKRAQRYISEAIATEFPDDSLLAEEGAGARETPQGNLWIVDPLDGTTNFLHGYAPFAVSIAYVRAGRPELGVVLSVAANELYVATRGGGATLNGAPICVSPTAELQRALLGTGFPYDRRERLDELMPMLRRALLTSHGVRRTGSAAHDLCQVARGGIDGFWERGLAPWDVAAGSLIVSEAGGRLSDGRGGAFALNSEWVIASNGHVHEALLASVLRGPAV